MIGWILILGCVVGTVLVWRLLAAHAPVSEADTCARCGYIVHGLPQPVCPECGSDLSAPGAVRPAGSSHWHSRRWWIAGGVVALTVAYVSVAMLVLERTPRVHQVKNSRSWTEPYSESFRSVKVDFGGETYQKAATSGSVRVTFTMNDGTLAALEVEPVSGRYRSVSGPAMISGSAFDSDAFQRWTQSIGLNTTNAPVAEELAVVETAVGQASTDSPSFKVGKPFRGASFTSSGGPDRRTHPVTAAHVLLAMAWIGGSAWLLRRARARSHTPAAASVL